MNRALLVLGILPAVGVAWPAGAAGTGVLAGPGSARVARYATPIAVVQVGDRPALTNTDINWHGLVATAVGNDDRPWCTVIDPAREESAANPRRYPLGQCPLFKAADVAPLGGTSAVQGLDAVVAGRVYAFRCTLVPGMTGNFIVN